jgi:hypothetical protein
MPTTGWRNPTAAANIDDAGGNSWINVNNVFVSDNAYADCTYSASNQHTDYVRATGYVFMIPVGATINGIEARTERRFAGIAPYYDRNVRIVKGLVIGAANRASAVQWPVADTYIIYGGPADLWGEVWTAADINAAGFGYAHSGTANSGWHTHHWYIDNMQIRVTYTLAMQSAELDISACDCANEIAVETVD